MNQFRTYKTVALFGASLICASLLGGCASAEAVAKAQATADQANATANKAQQDVKALSEKMDRMFKKTMQK